jgi:hypothetical protein
MFVGTPAAQLSGSFGHGHPTHSRGVVIGRDAAAIVIDFDAETVVHTGYPDGNPLCTGVFRRVANGLLPDAVGSDLDRCREYREITRVLESNDRSALRARHRADFGVLLKCRKQASMVEGWWAKTFHQAANVCQRGLLQSVQLL